MALKRQTANGLGFRVWHDRLWDPQNADFAWRREHSGGGESVEGLVKPNCPDAV